ncbi:MAG: DUF488 domain-containing protein [Deltaproteobacteria bacterium]|nr:DUF488 domain-containing protein [Deltaproteobacteria bacterium]
MEVYTIGFAKKKARQFFSALRKAGIKRLIDVRLNNSSQLAGFTKRDDLSFFLEQLCDAEYIHMPILAPTKDILDDYKNKKITWQDYERRFMALMAEREIEEKVDKALFDVPAVLLCSEPTADHCHRRLVSEYLKDKWGSIKIVHL